MVESQRNSNNAYNSIRRPGPMADRPKTYPVQKMDCINWVTLKIEEDGCVKTVNVTENMAKLLFSERVDPNTKKSLLADIVSQQARSPGNVCERQQENNPATSKLPVIDHNGNKLQNTNNPTPGVLDPASKWTQAAEKLLLAKHKDIEESKLPIKNKWKKISDDMHCHNYDFTPEQCRLKYQNN